VENTRPETAASAKESKNVRIFLVPQSAALHVIRIDSEAFVFPNVHLCPRFLFRFIILGLLGIISKEVEYYSVIPMIFTSLIHIATLNKHVMARLIRAFEFWYIVFNSIIYVRSWILLVEDVRVILFIVLFFDVFFGFSLDASRNSNITQPGIHVFMFVFLSVSIATVVTLHFLFMFGFLTNIRSLSFVLLEPTESQKHSFFITIDDLTFSSTTYLVAYFIRILFLRFQSN
jgi:hypothetical protein